MSSAQLWSCAIAPCKPSDARRSAYYSKKIMKYCEKCKCLVKGNICDICGSDSLREIRPDDFCLLSECDNRFGEMLKKAFYEEDITCALVPCGDGVRSRFALRLENVLVYVPYGCFEHAKQILYELSDTDNTEHLRDELIDNFEKWNFENDKKLVKYAKFLGLKAGDDIMVAILQIVSDSYAILDKGQSSSLSLGHYIYVRSENFNVMFASKSFTILSIDDYTD